MVRTTTYFFGLSDLNISCNRAFGDSEEYPDGVQYHQSVAYHPDSHDRDSCCEEDVTIQKVKVCNTHIYISVGCSNCRRRLTLQTISNTGMNLESTFLRVGEDHADEGFWSIA